MPRLCGEHVLGVRPRRVAVGEVVRPHESPHIAKIRHLERHPVILERGVHVLAEVLARLLRERPRGEPVAVPLPGVVHPVHEVRDPARVGLHAHELELRVPLEDAPQDEHADDVLAAPDDREEAVETGAPRLEAVSLARQDVEGQRQAEVDGRLVERRVDGIVVVCDGRIARHHHAAEPERLHLAQVLDALLHRPHRGLPDADEAVGVRSAVLRDPAVIGVEACVLVVEIRVIAEHHPDGRIEDLGADPVHVLLAEPRLGIEAARVHVLHPGAEHPELLGGLAGGGDEPHRDGLVHSVDDEEVAALGIAHDVGRPVAEAPVDAVDIRARRLGDVRIRGDDRLGHARTLHVAPGSAARTSTVPRRAEPRQGGAGPTGHPRGRDRREGRLSAPSRNGDGAGLAGSVSTSLS